MLCPDVGSDPRHPSRIVAQPEEMKTLFLDESGTHELIGIQADYPVFVLAGVICDDRYAFGELERRVREFKLELFNTDSIILHTADIVRPQNGFGRLGVDEAFRNRFYRELNDLMRDLRYTVVACVIKKPEHVKRYGPRAADPYYFALQPIIERFCYDIGSVPGGGRIIAECRRPDLDAQLKAVYNEICDAGTLYLSGAKVRHRLAGLECIPKKQNISGLQIADLVATPIGRYVLGKPTRKDFEIIREKFRGGPQNFVGRGLVVLPKT
jgi:hypothetical protein